jgi:hypothetical protein
MFTPCVTAAISRYPPGEAHSPPAASPLVTPQRLWEGSLTPRTDCPRRAKSASETPPRHHLYATLWLHPQRAGDGYAPTPAADGVARQPPAAFAATQQLQPTQRLSISVAKNAFRDRMPHATQFARPERAPYGALPARSRRVTRNRLPTAMRLICRPSLHFVVCRLAPNLHNSNNLRIVSPKARLATIRLPRQNPSSRLPPDLDSQTRQTRADNVKQSPPNRRRHVNARRPLRTLAIHPHWVRSSMEPRFPAGGDKRQAARDGDTSG